MNEQIQHMMNLLTRQRKLDNAKKDTIQRVAKVAVEVELQDGHFETLVLEPPKETPGMITVRRNFLQPNEADISIQIENMEVREGSWI